MATSDEIKLTARQEKVLTLLLSEHSVKVAATLASVGERTVHRWLRDESFAAAYRDARTAIVRQALGQIQAALGMAGKNP